MYRLFCIETKDKMYDYSYPTYELAVEKMDEMAEKYNAIVLKSPNDKTIHTLFLGKHKFTYN